MSGKDSSHNRKLILHGTLQDVRGFGGEVQVLINNIRNQEITGTLSARIISDESDIKFEGKIKGKMMKEKMILSYVVGSGNAIEFVYEGDVVNLEKGIGVSGCYRISAHSRNVFLRAGIMNLLETKARPQISDTNLSDDAKKVTK